MNNVDRQYVGYIYLTTNLLNGKIYVGMHRVRDDQQDKNTGYNMKDGGIGGFNIDVSGANNPMFGIHRYGEDNPNYGNRRTEASRLQQSNSIVQNGGHHGEKNPMFGRSQFGFKWWCDGINPPIKSKTSPGEQYHRGRI